MNKNILYSIILTGLLLFQTGCSSEEINTGGGGVETDGEVEMMFRLSVPDPELKPAQTRAQTVDETKIHTADVLVFTQTGGTSAPFTYAYRVKGGITASGNPVSGFKARLKTSSVPVKVLLLTNVDIPGQLAEPALGTSEATVRNDLWIQPQPGAMPAAGIPMFGEYTFSGGISAQYSREVNGIKMFRSMAKVTVDIDPAFAARFQLTQVYVARSRSRMALVPANTDAAGLVTDVRIPVDADLSPLAPVSVQPVTASFYLAEDTGFATAQEMATGKGSDKNTCIIIGGRLDGGAETFYRLDIQHGPKDQEVYGRIVRNNHYRITVTGITRPGKASLSLALAEGLPTLLYKSYFTPYDLGGGLTTIVFDGIEQLSAAEKQILLMPEVGTRDLPVSPGAVNTGVQVALYSGGAIVGAFGSTANLPSMGGTATIAMVGSAPVLRVTSAANTGTTDLKEQIALKTPTKVLLLDIIKKSPQTAGIQAVVDGAVTNPQRAEFLATGGTKIITVTSSTPWQAQGFPDWIRARKLSETQLEISIAKAQSETAREITFGVKNALGQTAYITAYQQYNLEWSNAYTKGGVHGPDNLYSQWVTANPMKRRYFTPPTVSGTQPLQFAAPAGDVVSILPREKLSSDFPTPESLQYPNGINPEMAGDFYDVSLPSEQVCPSGWRFPYESEIEILFNNLKRDTNAWYIQQGATRVYFPIIGYQNSLISFTANIAAQRDYSAFQTGDIVFGKNYNYTSHIMIIVIEQFIKPITISANYGYIRCVR